MQAGFGLYARMPSSNVLRYAVFLMYITNISWAMYILLLFEYYRQ